MRLKERSGAPCSGARSGLEAAERKAKSLWHACLRLLAPAACRINSRSTIANAIQSHRKARATVPSLLKTASTN